MKKILSVLLATLMLLGTFAIGASAISLKEFPAADEGTAAILGRAKSSAAAFVPGKVEAADADEDEEEADEAEAKFRTDVSAWLEEAWANYEEKTRTSPAYFAIHFLSDNEKAYKDGKTLEGLIKAYSSATNDMPAADALDAFMNPAEDDYEAALAAIRAEYDAGTLQKKIADLHEAALKEELAINETLANEFFSKNAMAFAKTYSKYTALIFALYNADLTNEEFDEISDKLDRIWTREFDKALDQAMEDGNFKEANRLIKNLVTNYTKILSNYDVVKPVTFWTVLLDVLKAIWNFILKWIFFGWIWM